MVYHTLLICSALTLKVALDTDRLATAKETRWTFLKAEVIKLHPAAAQALVCVGTNALLAEGVARLAELPLPWVSTWRANLNALACLFNLKVRACVAFKGRGAGAAGDGGRALGGAGDALSAGQKGVVGAAGHTHSLKANPAARVAIGWPWSGATLHTLRITIKASILCCAICELRTGGHAASKVLDILAGVAIGVCHAVAALGGALWVARKARKRGIERTRDARSV